MAKKYYKFMGCLTGLLFVTTLVFYIILMVRSFTSGVNWLTAAFLIIGIVALLTVVPTLANFFMGRGCRGDKYHLNEKE